MLNLFTTTASIATWHTSKSGFLVATEMAFQVSRFLTGITEVLGRFLL